jgi:hypothetical protein
VGGAGRLGTDRVRDRLGGWVGKVGLGFRVG